MKTVAGVFASQTDAEHAIHDLRAKGISDRDISLVSRRGEAEDHREGRNRISSGVAWGGTVGGTLGLLAGLGALAIPGIGPIVAAGPLAATLTGAAAGGLGGGLLDYGFPAQESERYQEDVKRGETLVLVHAPNDQTDEARRVLEQHHAHDIHEH